MAAAPPVGEPVPPPPGVGRKTHAPPFLAVFLPNRVVSRWVMVAVVAFQVACFLLLWIFSPFKVLPNPAEVMAGLSDVWFKQGLAPALLSSAATNLKALGLSLVISLGLAYLTVIPFFRPIVSVISKLRFLSFVGVSVLITIAFGGGERLKLTLLVMAITFFFVTSMAQVVADVPREAYDHARTLRMSEGQVVWEVVIRGTLDKAFEALRQNAAIGWLMLTFVEGIVRAGGGVGVLLLDQQKFFKLENIFAIQLVILLVALLQDWLIGVVRRLVCPYADLTLERRS